MTSESLRPQLSGHWSAFEALSGREVHDLLKLRQEIFVVEQECPYGDIDGKDLEALHYRQIDPQTGALAGAVRVFLPDDANGAARIGRVVIASAYRGGGRGRDLMQAAIDRVTELAPAAEIHLAAQAHLENFYASLGFVKSSEPYLEDDIPHIDMVRQPGV